MKEFIQNNDQPLCDDKDQDSSLQLLMKFNPGDRLKRGLSGLFRKYSQCGSHVRSTCVSKPEKFVQQMETISFLVQQNDRIDQMAG